MDQPGLASADHRQALAGLARINAWSGSAALLWRALRPLYRQLPEGDKPLRVLDIASGAGDVCRGVASRAAAAGLPIEITGIDLSPVAMEYARARNTFPNVRFVQRDVFRDGLTGDYHVSMSSLFLHHLTEAQAVQLLRQCAAVSSLAVVINDLRRSQLGIAVAHAVCRVLSRSSIVHADGPQSVAAAFTLGEMRELFQQAELHSVVVSAHWPFRQLAQWKRT